jgi:predicted DNA-binding transcriptional regulator AlpA
MGITELINYDVLKKIINDEVERLATVKFEEFKKELLVNYSFDDKLLNREDTAKKLDISVRQVDNLVEKGKLKKGSIGRSVKFKNSDVLAYINGIK